MGTRKLKVSKDLAIEGLMKCKGCKVDLLVCVVCGRPAARGYL